MGVSVPAYAVLVWLRAARWRHLTDPIQPIPTRALARAVAVGFMANNIFPLRIGEVVRCWYLRRETEASIAALFGTVVLERAIDAVCVIGLALLVVGVWGAGGEGELAQGAILLVPAALLPVGGLILLRVAPERTIGWLVWFASPLPRRVPEFLENQLRRFSEGLGALRGGSHLGWIAIHSLLIWLVVSPLAIFAALEALHLNLAWPGQAIAASWTTQAAVGVAVALPSAPGFFGLFHYACRVALVRFGISPDAAVAAGTLIHSVMWLTLTAMGLAVLRIRRTSLSEVDGGADPPASSAK